MIIRIDEHIEDADWIKTRHWDLPTTVGELIALFGRDRLPGLLTVPAAQAMPPELRQQIVAEIGRAATKTALVDRLDGIMAEVKVRHVIDSAFWGAPVGTPLPLPPKYQRHKPDPKPQRFPDFKFKTVPDPPPSYLTDMDRSRLIADEEDGDAALPSKRLVYTDDVIGVNATVYTRPADDGAKPAWLKNYLRVEGGPYAGVYDLDWYDGPLDGDSRHATSARRRAEFILKLPYIEAEERRLSLLPERKTKGFIDTWRGIYGVDYEDGLIDPNDEQERFALAKVHAEELGVTYFGREDEFFSLEAVETINAIVEAMEKVVPGITDYVPDFGLISTNAGAETWPVPGDMGDPEMSQFVPVLHGYPASAFFYRDGFTYDHAAIGVNDQFYSDTDRSRANLALYYEGHKRNPHTGMFSLDEYAPVSSMEMTPAQALYTTMIVHEMGHAIGYTAFGDINDGTGFPDERARLRRNFRTELFSIFADFGLIEREDADPRISLSSEDTRYANSALNTIGPLYIDQGMVATLLGQYGASNMQEMLAEVWTEYTLAKRPRPFAQAVGELMERHFNAFHALGRSGRETA